jgi:flagellin-specific chaperone FliS
VSKDPEIMKEILTHLRSMRDNWIEVMKTAPDVKRAAK